MVTIKSFIPKTFTSLRVKEEGDDETTYNGWTNKDIVPVPIVQRRFTWHAFFGYWVAAGVTTTTWSLGSSNIANGLTVGEAIGGVLVGSFLAGCVAFVCGEPGVKYHMGFPMMSRSTFGMYGSYFVVILKLFVNFIFCGIQVYWGGLAVKVILASIFPTFQHMKNTLPASAVIETDELIGFVVFIFIFTPLMFKHPSRMQPILFGAFFLVGTTILGLFIWAVASNGGAKPLAPTKHINGSTRSFLILKAMSAVAGSFTGGSIRQSDWTRFSKTKRAPVISQLVGAPLTITITATLGAFATSAVKEMYGKAIWNPIELLAFLMDQHYNSKTRAGCFFAGIGFLCSQISVNLAQNSISCGMDLAAMFPRWIDVTRGSLIMCIVGYLIQPWRFVKESSTFITVLNSFGMFVAPLAGINAIDFWIVRHRRWNVPDLYRGDSSSIYWYDAGLNWRAFAAWTLTIWASFPGFLNAVAGTNVSLGWIRAYQITWVIGFCGGATIYWALCLISPPPGAPYIDIPSMSPEEMNGEEYNVDKGSDLDVEKAGTADSAVPIHHKA